MKIPILRNYLVIASFLSLCCCGPGQELKVRAVQFYNLFSGTTTNKTLEDFLLPDVKEELALGKGLEGIKAIQKALASSGRIGKFAIKEDEVQVRISGHFGVSWVEVPSDRPASQIKPIKWVKSGGSWFLYQATPAQIKKYGLFPPELLPQEPQIPRLTPNKTDTRNKGLVRKKQQQRQ